MGRAVEEAFSVLFAVLEESFFGRMKKMNGQLHKAHLLDQPTAHRIQSPSPNIYSTM